VGRHFFEHDFYQADGLSGLGNKEFIADLMPKHPIYIPLLPASVQAVIGRVHHETIPALNLLLAEGFVQTTEVDIFDAGPLVRATLAEVRTVKQTRVLVVEKLIPPSPSVEPTHLIGNESLDFRAAVGAFNNDPEGSSVSLETNLAETLRLKPGDKVSLTPLH
jgi:arginine N-succinyltransferase